MKGLKIGHFTLSQQGTGVSVFLFEPYAVGSYWLCGSAPATHELGVLEPENCVQVCHGLVFAGGSAFGLQSAGGVLQYLLEKGVGQPVPGGVVPIVPAAALYDLYYKQRTFPLAEHAYQACLTASEDNQDSGALGAGTGATVGKLIPGACFMTGGIGRARLIQESGLEVVAYVAVNCVGDVVRDQQILAGAANADGSLINTERYLLSGAAENDLFPEVSNTALALIVTNAKLTKDMARRIAKTATAGLARSISPVSTLFDGDIVFCMSVGSHPVAHATELTLGAMATEAVQHAVYDAVKDTQVVKD